MGAIGFNSQGQLQVGGNAVNYGKNYIINGGFDRWNYATSQTTSGYGSDDRWDNINVGSTKTHSLVNSGDAERTLFSSSKFSRTVVTSVAGAGNAVVKKQHIENVTKLAGKTITISFKAKADSNKNMAIEFQQHFGFGGTPSASITGIGSQLIALTSTWQYKTVTITLPSLIGKTLGTDGVHTSRTSMNLWFEGGSTYATQSANLGQQSGTFDIAEVQLEEGSVATPWTPYNGEFGGEEQACQRYYEKVGTNTYFTGYSITGIANSYFNLLFKTYKRIVPTITMYSTDGTAGSMDLYNSASPTKLAVISEVTSLSQYTFRYGVSGYTLAIGTYAISAEL